jgi:uncharacterized protein (DUF1800 family)
LEINVHLTPFIFATMSTLEAFMSDVITDIQVDDKTTQALPFKATLTASAAASFLEACGGGGGNSSSSPVVNASTVSDKITYAADYAAARFLQHAQFSSSEADITAVKNMGASAWLDAQMALPSSTGGWDWLAMRGYNVIDSNKFYEMDYQANYMAWQQIMSSPDGVRRRLALALSEFFVVSISGVSTISWSQFAMGHYWDILCKTALGNYRQLVEEVTLSIAMGEFLNTLGNQKEDLATGRLPDENYAREVMQLFTIGLQQLNIDGTVVKVNGAPVDTFTQSDVSNLARVFTGYQADDTEGFSDTVVAPTYKVRNVGYTRRPMVLNANRHSMLRAEFLGAVVPAGTEGKAALKIALDTLFMHANVGPFFGRQMIQRLVCSNPSPAYVARVATVFNNNGKGVRGDLAAVFKAILTDVEATQDSGLTNPSFGKLREPMVRVAQWARTFKVSSIKGTWKIGNPNYSAVNALGQSPLQAPSVFNFFRPGYVPPNTALASMQYTAPEFQLVNESTTASYINYLEDILVNGIWVRAPELITSPSDKTATDGFDIAPDYTAEMNLAGNAPALFARLNMLLCAGQLSDATLKDMINVFVVDKTNSASNDNNKRSYVAKAIMFVMCCAEYLVQK